MSRVEAMPTRLLALSGVIFCIAALALVLVAPASALLGWLSALVFVSALPLGALCLVMMMRIIPGIWRHDLDHAARSSLSLLPLVLIAWLPILFGLSFVYEWVRQPLSEPFKAIYLTPLFFDLRTLFILAAAYLLAQALLRSQSLSVAVGGLIGFVLLQEILATDWLMSLDPHFHSSGFALYVLTGQMLTALALLVLLSLGEGGVAKPSVLGALLITAILFWAYLAFMQYFIIWSGNLVQGALWFQRRGTGIWSLVELSIAFLHLTPLFLLFFPPIRRSRRWLIVLISIILAGRLLEYAWLILPQLTSHLGYAIAAYGLSLGGLAQITLAILSRASKVVHRLTTAAEAS
ncbi:hypothetical protein [Rhizobium sp. IMFF44]|uniref:hypothetical protein n=1 Tax=Rhizobium sp. IMFF44 TaxID=3342350 RepID=UPI0035B8D9CC